MTATPDALLFARLQFAANMTFHILFPAISIGLAWLLVFFRLRANRSGAASWAQAYTFWVKVFALTFALGVVSGVTLSFQFGTNWPGYMRTVGNIAGPLLSFEILMAFFLEAAFLGVMLFGGSRVSPRVHALAAVMVAVGTTLSAFWILALDSWMQTPAGFTLIDGQAHATSWLAVIFNPSFPYRLTHMVLASGLTASFLVAGISAYRWLRGQTGADVQAALRTAVRLAAVLIPLQIVAGDQHGLNTLEHQPAKIAAMEGLWQTARGAPMVVIGLPDEAARANRYEIAIPNLASLYLTHSLDGEIKGLDDFADHPPVAPVFFAFRVMVGTGMLMLAVSWFAAWKLRRGRAPTVGLSRALVAMTFSGWVAVLAGWYTTEVGRQPWLATGVLRTADAASSVPAPMIATTLAMYLMLYAGLIVAYVSVLFYMAGKAGPAATSTEMQHA
ncbi:MAG TPA: cytochrome ubiquinol oxidase subunit I [Burkholderiales bacterium]|nr:cytochrome ubiquinol oxidase subunit I [Burkholderiales bacterium]